MLMNMHSDKTGQWRIGMLLCLATLMSAGSAPRVRGDEPVAADAPDVAASVRAAAAPRSLKNHNLPGLDAKVNLTSMEPMDVVQLIDFLAHRGGLKNIVIGRGVQGLTAKIRFDNVTVAEALEVVLSVNQLAYEIKGDIVTILTDEEYKAMHGVSFYDHKDVQIVGLKYADPARVAQMLASVKSAIGTVAADPVSGTLILVDTPAKIAEMRRVIETADIPTVSRVIPTRTRNFTLQHAAVDDMVREVQAILSPDVGAVRADQRTRTLIVTDLEHKMAEIEKLMALFDRPSRQVFIEAKIVETTLSDDFSLGINWHHLFASLDPAFAVETVLSPMGPTALPNPAASLTYSAIDSRRSLEAVIQALESFGDTKILANPHIAVLDGQEARIEVIEDQPYKEVTMEAGTTNVTGVTYLFKKVGVQLAVTPRINDEHFIHVAVTPEISSISQWYDGAPQEGTPVVRKAYAETTVMVKDGVTIIIGGMIQNRTSSQSRQTPFLGRIPILGALFRYKTTSSVNSETVVFLTPRIVTGETPHQLLDRMPKEPKPMRNVGIDNRGAKPVR